MLSLPPLSLYIHLPWCIARCPYCDFNAWALDGELPEKRYIDALLADLELELPRVWQRPVVSIFIGGGTPSLFSAQGMRSEERRVGKECRCGLTRDHENKTKVRKEGFEKILLLAHRA